MFAEILLVDDNAIQATTRRSVLLRTGRSVAIASGALQALTLLDEDAELRKSLRLVITDHMMPGMNGPEFVARLQEELPFVPVIVLTGFPDAEAEYESGKVQFRMKPAPPDQLIALVESLLNRSLTRTA
jgi:CheY-like chemotaxis protein